MDLIDAADRIHDLLASIAGQDHVTALVDAIGEMPEDDVRLTLFTAIMLLEAEWNPEAAR
jgi:hypothetical protein